MCDSNRVKGTVKQYLVTEDNDIVVNELGTFEAFLDTVFPMALKSHSLKLDERLKTS